MVIIMVILSLHCPKCDGSENICKNGHSISGHQHYQCTDCRHTFQTDYSMKGSEPGMHEKIVAMAINHSGYRETVLVLGISLNMALRHLKNQILLRKLSRSPIKIQSLSVQ